MDWLRTWGGKCFGYRDGDDLWTYDGRHVGRFDDEEIYSPTGEYLGEIISDDRLITHKSKRSQRRAPFSPGRRRTGHVKCVNYVGYVMYAGYEDFPPPEDITT